MLELGLLFILNFMFGKKGVRKEIVLKITVLLENSKAFRLCNLVWRQGRDGQQQG
jgi:hypothetical protein